MRLTARIASLLPMVLLVALALPATSSAQATRTWVSGVGDDVNPCSRTAPCKTFAGAISKTAAGGEIDVLDPGGFGPVTITKSITIDGRGENSSILATGTTGIIVNTANTTDKVTIRDINIIGARGTAFPGVTGIRIIRAGAVRVEDVNIYGFNTTGILMESNHSGARLTVEDSSVHDNAAGMKVAPTAVGAIIRATVRRSSFDDNGSGLRALSTGGTALTVVRSSVTDSGIPGGDGLAVVASGANTTVRVAGNEIQGNKVGLRASDGGSILSAGDNDVFNNSVEDGLPTGTWTKR